MALMYQRVKDALVDQIVSAATLALGRRKMKVAKHAKVSTCVRKIIFTDILTTVELNLLTWANLG